MKIIYEDNHLLVVNKPVNIPVQADSSKDTDLSEMLKQYLKEKYNKPGNVYLGLIHRLDRPVSGVMVFAKTSKAANRLSKQIQNHSFKKTYLAVIDGVLTKEGKLIDYLIKDKKTNISKVDETGKKAILNYNVIKNVKNFTLVKIDLITGRSHQIRVQFSSRGYPLYGDQKYNKHSKVGTQIALLSYMVEFNHPITKEEMVFKIDVPSEGVWKIFNN